MHHIIKYFPEKMRTSIFFRFFYKKQERYHQKFKNVSLAYSQNILVDLISTDVMHGQIAFTGFYELPLTQRVAKLAKGGGTMVDIGANIGYFSLLWASLNPKNIVYSIEPSTRVFHLLNHNVKKNNLQNSITLFQVAASDSDCTLVFELGDVKQTGWGKVVETSLSKTIEVQGRCIDDILPDLQSIELMKMDIEGYELFAIKGCKNYLKHKKVKEIHFEQNKPNQKKLGISLSEPMDFLKSLGYRCKPTSPENRDCVDWVAVPE